MIKLHLFDTTPFFDTPYQLLGWVGWFILAALIIWVVRQNLSSSRSQHFWVTFLLFVFATILTASFIGIELPIKSALPLATVPSESTVPVVMVFSAFPFLLAGGLLGVWPAAILGFISGTVSALWNTHTIFTPLESAAVSVLLALAIRQDYRTRFFEFLRHPFGAALVVSLLSFPLYLLSTFFGTNGTMAVRLDFSFTRSWVLVLTNGIPLLVAGLLGEIIQVRKWRGWIQPDALRPSPMEESLQSRILYTSVPIVLVLLLGLMMADWIVAGKAAQEILVDQLENSAAIAADNIPSLIETGQNLTLSIADSELPLNNPDKLQKILKTKIRELPFFNQIHVFDLTGSPLISYPDEESDSFHATAEEENGIQLALNGVQVQHYVIAPYPGETSAMISFIASIPDEYGLAKGVVLARTNLTINLFSQPALLALESIAGAGGQGAILDETNRILYHTNPKLVMSVYSGEIPQRSGYFEDPGTTGTRSMNYAKVDEETGWKVILTMPAKYSQQLALRIAIPLLVISLTVSVLAFLLLRYLMKSLTTSLVRLADRADGIARGELTSPIEDMGVDEIGRLASAFEQMRVSLKNRLDEMDTLLRVSQGMASDLNLEASSSLLLEALLKYGADGASLVLVQNDQHSGTREFQSFRTGEEMEEYAYLDQLLLDQVKEENLLIIPSKARIRRLGIPRGMEVPSALAAILLKSDDHDVAYFWLVYNQPHQFNDAEIRFLNTLAGQALLAITNSILYMNAEVGKKRLESVLASTPEPVMVAGEQGQLLISNEAAVQLRELVNAFQTDEEFEGEIVSQILREFILATPLGETREEEKELENGRVYVVSVSPVEVEKFQVGRVCVLRDVTDYKQLEKKKSEYVSTVSHDLKAPMSLIRGYASMLPMVGDLNEQQREYLSKIMEGIEDISSMADDLLDLRRIDSEDLIDLQKVSPAELLAKVVEEMQPQIMNRKIQVMPELTLAQDLTVEVDRTLIHRALYNLLENAIKFSPIGGQINLRLQANPNHVVFVIQDHGPGIAPLDLPDLFNRVKRVTTRDGKTVKDSGLGLSIVRSIAERHQGKVWAESQLGKGSTFYLEIPLRQVRKI